MSDLQQYDESSVTVLKGLEPVKQRPGMYTRTDNPTHICQEVIDNAADEALGGYADTISVAIHSDGVGIATQGLIGGIVYDFLTNVGRIIGAGVHTRALLNRL